MAWSGRILLAAALAANAAAALCAGPGREAAPFLKIDFGARAAAMGGAFTAVAEDASAVYYNPAGTGLMNYDDVMLSHSEWFAGLRNENFAYVHPLTERLTFLTGLSLLLSPGLDKYDENGAKTGTFSALDGALGAGLAWAFTPDFCFGFAGKGVHQRADKEKAYAYAGDAGFIHRSGNLRFGLAAQNLGTPMKLYKEEFPLPMTIRGGAAYHLNERLWLAADLAHSSAGLGYAGGAEAELPVSVAETVYLRAGYKGGIKSAGPGYTAGVGLKSGELRFDYAFAPYGDLGDGHRLSVSFKFGDNREFLTREKKIRHLTRKAEHAETLRGDQDRQAPPGNGPKKGSRQKGAQPNGEPARKEPPKKDVYFMW